MELESSFDDPAARLGLTLSAFPQPVGPPALAFQRPW